MAAGKSPRLSWWATDQLNLCKGATSNMSETEFVLVAFWIMLALALAFAKLMQGIVRGATCEGRYWIHLA